MTDMPPPPPPSMGPPGPPPGYHVYGGIGQTPPSSLGKATASMVCGIVGLVLTCLCGVSIVLAVLAIVFGIQAKKQIDANPGAFTNRSQAQAGFVLGIIGMSLSTIFIAFVLAR